MTVRVVDNGSPSLSSTQSFQVVVTEVNTPPVLAVPADRTVNPGEVVSFINTATDADAPASAFVFNLHSGPVGAVVDPVTGRFTWRPGIASANTTNTVQVRVTDSGTTPLSDTRGFKIIVRPLAPVTLTPLGFSGSDFRISINGPVGPDYILQTTNVLGRSAQPWVNLTTTNPLVSPFQLTVPNVRGITNRFYRVLLGP